MQTPFDIICTDDYSDFQRWDRETVIEVDVNEPEVPYSLGDYQWRSAYFWKPVIRRSWKTTDNDIIFKGAY